MKVSKYGEITHLQGAKHEEELNLEGIVSEANPIGGVYYQSFNDSQFAPFTYAYMNDHQMQAGFSKPGSNAWTVSGIFMPKLVKL